VEQVAERFSREQTSTFKQKLAELLVEKLSPIRTRIEQLKAEPEQVDKVLKDGAQRALELATKHLGEIKTILGLKQ
jgi:tryptophanyl-tRNA synthetase